MVNHGRTATFWPSLDCTPLQLCTTIPLRSTQFEALSNVHIAQSKDISNRFCDMSWVLPCVLVAARTASKLQKYFFSSKSKTLTWCFISPLCNSSVLSLLCSQLPWLSESLRSCWCWIWGTLRSHWRWILPISYVVFGGLPRRFGVEASWRHGTAFRSAERHMFDLQILNSMRSIGGNNWTGKELSLWTHCKICLHCWYQVVPPPSKKHGRPAPRNVIAPHPTPTPHTSHVATCMRVPRNVITPHPAPNPKPKKTPKKEENVRFVASRWSKFTKKSAPAVTANTW